MPKTSSTPQDLRARALQRLERLGPPPDEARDCVHWRDRRDSAALELAALADGNPVLLAQAASLAGAEGDEDTHDLLREAGDWTPSIRMERTNGPGGYAE